MNFYCNSPQKYPLLRRENYGLVTMSSTSNQLLALSHLQGTRLKQVREITRLSRRAFALKHGLSPATLQNWEEGRYERGLTEKVALNLIQIFQTENINLSIEWLLYGEGSPPQHQFDIVKKQLIPELTLSSNKNELDEITLLQQTAENHKKHEQNRKLFEAVKNGRYKEVTDLITMGTDIYHCIGITLRPYNNEYNTPLHLAAALGYLDIAKYLLKKGADVNARNRKKQTPLHLAVFNAHKDIIKYLIVHKAEINAVEDEGDSPLAWAVYKGQTAILSLLIELKANIHIQNKIGNTPLHWVAEEGYVDVAKVLLEQGGHQGLSVKNHMGDTPLLVAVQNGRMEMVKFLLKEYPQAISQ